MAEIDEEKCIACGLCFNSCPKQARNIENEVETVTKMLGSGKRVAACLDSSYLGSFERPGQLVHALKKLGFDSVQEVAVGSEKVMNEYIKYIQENAGKQKYFISSTCPSIYIFIQKYHPTLVKYLIPVVTPMVALGAAIKKEDPDVYTVYIGPCLSKKYETLPKRDDAPINSLITCQEIIKMLLWNNIDYKSLEPIMPDRVPQNIGTSYSISGDLWPHMTKMLDEKGYMTLGVNGLDNVKQLFLSMENQTLSDCYIGISACVESCINGPFIPKQSLELFCRRQRITHFAAQHGWAKKARLEDVNWKGIDLKREFAPIKLIQKKATDDELKEILVRMGRRTRAEEYDCGACGYSTCREKAQAVFEGMSDVSMCGPSLRKKAEKKSDVIFMNTRNIVIFLDKDKIITGFNPKAETAFGITSAEVVGKHISCLGLSDDDYSYSLREKKDILNKKIYLEKYGIIVMQNITYVDDDELFVSLKDITEDEKNREELAKLKMHTVSVTQNVIEKQMRVAQEIASLLGETTAETKVALNKLKEVVLKEGE